MSVIRNQALLVIGLSLAIFCSPSLVFANGIIASWDMGGSKQPPFPVKNGTLELEQATVVFRGGKVIATYRVKNPSFRSIDVTMGLPLGHSGRALEGKVNAKDLLDGIKLSINGEDPGASWLTEDGKSGYPLVLNWLMTFPVGSSTEIIINYPSETKADGFQFITETGALWGKPIGKAVFSYCERDLSSLGSSNSVWTDGGWTLERHGIDAGPEPFVFNEESGCVVWERTEWLPRADVDNLRIKKGDSRVSYKYPWAHDANMGTFYDTSMARWCHPEKGGPSFAETIGLDRVDFDSLDLEEVSNKSYIFIAGTSDRCRSGSCDPFYKLPEHLATDYKLWLLRYLRNFIAARHGHKYIKDLPLKECFEGIETAKTGVSAIERKNAATIYKMESEIKKQNDKAWAAVNKNLQQQ